MVSAGKVHAQQIGGGERRGPEEWPMIDETVQDAYVHGGRLYVFKGGRVYHAAAGHSVTGTVAGPEAWPLVDASLQAALVTTDSRLGVAQYITSVGKPIYALDEAEASRLLADMVLEQSRSVDLAQQIAALSNSSHITGAMLATYTIIDLCQDFGMNAPTAKAVASKIRSFKRSGVPMSILKGQ